jgi:hypothetical protein
MRKKYRGSPASASRQSRNSVFGFGCRAGLVGSRRAASFGAVSMAGAKCDRQFQRGQHERQDGVEVAARRRTDPF